MTQGRNLDDQDVNAALRDLVREPAELPGDGLDKALAEAAVTPQVRRHHWWWPFSKESPPLPTTPETTLLPVDVAAAGQVVTPTPAPARFSPFARLVAAGALVAVVAFFIGTQLPSDEAVLPPAASPSSSPTATGQPEPTTSDLPAPTATTLPTPDRSPEPVALAPPSILVDPGGGDFATIAEAVASAADGDIIGVGPGTYDESITLVRDIEIRGLGNDRSEVVIRITGASATIPVEDPQDVLDGDLPSPYAFRLIDADASINGLTIESLVEGGTGFDIEGGAPELSDLAYVSEGGIGASFVHFDDGAGGTLRDSTSTADISFSGGATTLVTGVTLAPSLGHRAPTTWVDGLGTTARFIDNELFTVAIEGGSPTFEGNDISGVDAEFEDGISAFAGADTTATIRNNQIHDWPGSGVNTGGLFVIEGNDFEDNVTGVIVGPGAAATISGNTFDGSLLAAIRAEAGSRVNVVGNVITANAIGISTTTDGSGDALVPLGSVVLGTVDGNELVGNGTAIDLDGSGQIISNNTITGGSRGIVVRGAGSPTLENNSVTDATGEGILIQAASSPFVSGNDLCGNATNMDIEEGAEATIQDNDVCEEDVTVGNGAPDGISAGMAAVNCSPSTVCPLRGEGVIEASGLERTTLLSIGNGSYLTGAGGPFLLILENESNEMRIRGIAETGTYHQDDRFSATIDGWVIAGHVVDTDDGSDCTIDIRRADSASIRGSVLCDQHPTNGLPDPLDIKGEFEARIMDQGAASGIRGDSHQEGFEGEMSTFDSSRFFDGRLVDISAEFPAGPFELRYAGPAGSTMEITGLATPGSYTGAGDGFSLRVDQGESGVYRLDSANVNCEFALTRADEAGIEGAWSCPFLGDEATGFFNAIP